MPRTVGTTREELARLSEEKYKPWLGSDLKTPEEIIRQYLVITGGSNIKEAGSFMRQMLRCFHQDNLAKDGSLTSEEKELALERFAFLNNLKGKVLAIAVPEFERETVLIWLPFFGRFQQ